MKTARNREPNGVDDPPVRLGSTGIRYIALESEAWVEALRKWWSWDERNR